MKILVCIASYGFKNIGYLNRLVREYQNFSHEVHIEVVSDCKKDLGKKIKVTVGLPCKNPHSLPFAHKNIFFNNIEKYDLFVYSEDDILITEYNIKSFIENTKKLPDDKLCGFLRYEEDSYGNKYCPDAETRFHWILNSVENHEGDLFAQFGNHHSASYILTKKQLAKAIESGGYLVPPHEGDYDLECSAATDPYTQCGFKKLINISKLTNILVHHLPNRYLGLRGISIEELYAQIDALKKYFFMEIKIESLFETRKNVLIRDWDKQFYENNDNEILKFCEGKNKNILSIGSGFGRIEETLKKFGHKVVSIPVDNIIAESLRYRNIETIETNIRKIEEKSEKHNFNCILLSDVLHHLPEPYSLLNISIKIIKNNGSIVIKTPNFNFFRFKKYKSHSYEQTKLSCIEIVDLVRWLEKNGFKVSIKPKGSERYECLFRFFGTVMSKKLAREFVVVAEKNIFNSI